MMYYIYMIENNLDHEPRRFTMRILDTTLWPYMPNSEPFRYNHGVYRRVARFGRYILAVRTYLFF